VIHNRVLPLLFAAAALAVVSGGFVAMAPNRLLSGKPVGLFAACDWRISFAIAALGIVLLATAFVPPNRTLHRAASLLAAALLLLVMAASGEAAASLAATAPTLARVSLGAAFWVLAGAAPIPATPSAARAGSAAASADSGTINRPNSAIDGIVCKRFSTAKTGPCQFGRRAAAIPSGNPISNAAPTEAATSST